METVNLARVASVVIATMMGLAGSVALDPMEEQGVINRVVLTAEMGAVSKRIPPQVRNHNVLMAAWMDLQVPTAKPHVPPQNAKKTDATSKTESASMAAKTASGSILEEWNVHRSALQNVLMESALQPVLENVT